MTVDLLALARHRIDQLTPNVDGFTRTQVVTLAVAAYLHGMAEAHEHPQPRRVAAALAAEIRTLADGLIDECRIRRME